jgi:uncharacterized protein
VIAVDTNILIHAHWTDSPWHERADACVTSQAEGEAPWAIPWPCVYEFLAVATHPRIHDPPTPLRDALEQVGYWFEAPNLVLLGEISDHWATLRGLLERSKVVGPRVHDAKIAALCLHHGVTELWSADRDFAHFRGLKVVNPLVDG